MFNCHLDECQSILNSMPDIKCMYYIITILEIFERILEP